MYEEQKTENTERATFPGEIVIVEKVNFYPSEELKSIPAGSIVEYWEGHYSFTKCDDPSKKDSETRGVLLDDVNESGKTARILVCGKLDSKWMYNKYKEVADGEIITYDEFCIEYAFYFYSVYGMNVYLEKTI